MWGRGLISAVAVMLVSLLSSIAYAAPGLALVIGNSSYRGDGLTIPNPAADAQIMAAKLGARGFRVTLLADGDLAAMRQALGEFALKAAASPDPNASNFFYYSGHGIQIDGTNYLVPVDVSTASADDIVRSSLPLTEVLARLRGLRSRVNFIVLDACRNNPLGGGEGDVAPGLAQIDAVSNAFIAFSTSAGMAAFDGDGRNSRFTAALAMALSDETASAQDVFKRAREYVLRTSNGAQTPEYVDTIALAGGDPWSGMRVGAAYIGQTRGIITAQRNNLRGMDFIAARLRRSPAPQPGADLSSYVRAISAMLDTGAQEAAIKPDYMDETYAPMLRAVLTASRGAWSDYDLALFLAHAAQETYQFQALAEYGSEAFFARYQGRADLGNVQPGDGARYRGRGLLQLRGRAAYRRLGADPAVAFDLENSPDAVATDAALSARVSVAMYAPVRLALTGAPEADLVATTQALTGSQRDIGLRGHYFYRILQAIDALHRAEGYAQ